MGARPPNKGGAPLASSLASLLHLGGLLARVACNQAPASSAGALGQPLECAQLKSCARYQFEWERPLVVVVASSSSSSTGGAGSTRPIIIAWPPRARVSRWTKTSNWKAIDQLRCLHLFGRHTWSSIMFATCKAVGQLAGQRSFAALRSFVRSSSGRRGGAQSGPIGQQSRAAPPDCCPTAAGAKQIALGRRQGSASSIGA